MSPLPTGADLRLHERLRAEHLDLSPGKLIAWRQAGLLGKQAPGGSYQEDIVERTRAAKRLVEQHPRSLHKAVLAMFAEAEYEIETRNLHRALLRAVDDLLRDVRRASGTTDSDEIPFDAADRLARRLARTPSLAAMRARIPSRGRSLGRERREAILSSIIANLVNMFVNGKLLTNEVVNEIALAVGADDLRRELVPHALPMSEDQLVEWVVALASELQEHRLRERIADLNSAELASFRDDALLLERVFGRRDSESSLRMFRHHNHVQVAMSAVAMSIVADVAPVTYVAIVDAAREADKTGQP